MKVSDKSELLDTVEKVSVPNEYKTNVEVLKVFEKEDTVIAGHCVHCDTYHEFAFSEAEKIFLALSQPLEFTDKYLILHSCSACKGEDKTVEVKTF